MCILSTSFATVIIAPFCPAIGLMFYDIGETCYFTGWFRIIYSQQWLYI